MSWRDTRNVRRAGAQQARQQETPWWVNDDGIPATPDDPQELASMTVNGNKIRAVCFGPYDCRLMVEVSDGVWGTAGRYRTPQECGAGARQVQAFLLGGGTIRGGGPPKDQTVTGHIGMGTITNQNPE